MEHIERVQRELKYKGTILSMYADTIKVPNGNTAVWDFIGHQGAAAVVPVTDDGKILMARTNRRLKQLQENWKKKQDMLQSI